jgi:hypothetical protein
MSVRETITRLLERTGKLAGDMYLGFLGIGMMLGFPILCILGLIYLGAWAASFVGGILGIILFFGMPLFLLVLFSIYAWTPHVWPALERALRELRNSN